MSIFGQNHRTEYVQRNKSNIESVSSEAWNRRGSSTDALQGKGGCAPRISGEQAGQDGVDTCIDLLILYLRFPRRPTHHIQTPVSLPAAHTRVFPPRDRRTPTWTHEVFGRLRGHASLRTIWTGSGGGSERVMVRINWENKGINIYGEQLNHLRFADDFIIQ